MSWAARRQLVIVLIMLAIAGFFFFLFYSPVIFTPATCSDGKQNGSETGVDCGGSCVTLCSSEAQTPIVLWSRAFAVTPSVYNVVAYIENKNDAAVEAYPYEFRLYDAKGIFVTRVQGRALVPPQGRYAIVETGIGVGNATITRATFEFSDNHTPWTRIADDIRALHIATSSPALDKEDTVPTLTATLTNTSATVSLARIGVTAIVYDAQDNAINASKTIVPSLPASQSTQVYFTWPKPLSAKAIRYEIIPVINVFGVGQ